MTIENREKGVQRSRTFRNILAAYDLSAKSVIDIGCGYGEYLRFFGKGSIGITTTREEVAYGEEHHLNIIFGNAEKIDTLPLKEKFDAIWANNLFEHLLSPHSFLMKVRKISRAQTTLVLGVPVIPGIAVLTSCKWFRGALASNHINFFTHRTLRLTVERAGWKVVAVRPFLFRSILLDTLVRSFSPHVYVVAKCDKDFVYPKKKVSEWEADEQYAELLSLARPI